MRSEEHWQELAKADPLWAILSAPEKRGGGWGLSEFLRTGEDAAGGIARAMARHGLPLRRGRALDFGCGVGRVTGPIARSFRFCLGLDASSGMVERAREIWAGTPGLEFGVLGPDGLAAQARGSFDVVHSCLVLQHLPSRGAIRRTLSALAGLLAPGGVIIVQIPSHIPLRKRPQVRNLLYRAGRTVGIRPRRLLRLGLTPITMRALPVAEAVAVLAGAGCRLLEIERDDRAGPAIESVTYVAARGQ